MPPFSILLAQGSSGGFSWDRLFHSPGLTIVITGCVVGCLVATAAIVTTNLRGYHEAKQLNRLKADMVERGFSADEIAQVVESTPGAPSSRSARRP